MLLWAAAHGLQALVPPDELQLARVVVAACQHVVHDSTGLQWQLGVEKLLLHQLDRDTQRLNAPWLLMRSLQTHDVSTVHLVAQRGL